jgi:hypothetical protein
MENHSLDECIALIKNGKKVEARQVLQSILQSDLHNLNGWYWYVETFDTPEQKAKVLRLCLINNPDNRKVKDAIRTFETKYTQVVKRLPVGNKSTQNKIQPSRSKNNNKNLWIIGSIIVMGVISIICILAIGILLNNQLPVTTTPQSTIAPTLAPTQTNTPAAPFTGKWQISTSISEFDNSTTIALSLEAEDFIEGWLTTTMPTLVLRCKERDIAVYVKVGMQSNVEYGLNDAATVRIRFDQNQAFEAVANESTDGDALFFQDPHAMIIAMLKSNEMVFGFTPFNADPAVTTFDLSGLANVIDPLKQSCYWNGAYPTIPPLPTRMPTATSLPLGSSLTISTISGFGINKWKVGIETIIVTKSVSYLGDTTEAGEQFVLIFLRITNLASDPVGFLGYGLIQVRNAEGNYYGPEGLASLQASDMYNIPYGTTIQPGETVQRLVAFDLPLNSASYFLVPGSLADDYEQNLVIEIP